MIADLRCGLGWHRRHALRVSVRPHENRADIALGMVVGEHRGGEVARLPEIRAAGAEVFPGRERRIMHVVRAYLAVVVAVDGVTRPRGRDELHRARRSVPYRVTVPLARIGVGDGRDTGTAGQARSEDRRDRRAPCVDAAGARVTGLDSPDRGQHRPVQAASGVRLLQAAGRVDVGHQHRLRNAEWSARQVHQRPGAGGERLRLVGDRQQLGAQPWHSRELIGAEHVHGRR
jgi:hypothetical protein